VQPPVAPTSNYNWGVPPPVLEVLPMLLVLLLMLLALLLMLLALALVLLALALMLLAQCSMLVTPPSMRLHAVAQEKPCSLAAARAWKAASPQQHCNKAARIQPQSSNQTNTC